MNQLFLKMYVEVILLTQANAMAARFGAAVKPYGSGIYCVVLNGKDIVFAELPILHGLLERMCEREEEIKKEMNF